MSLHLRLAIRELAQKGISARRDIATAAALKKISTPSDGTCFLVGTELVEWSSEESSQDDGVNFFKPEEVDASKPGRYRVVRLERPKK